jgi:hypothetical protein
MITHGSENTAAPLARYSVRRPGVSLRATGGATGPEASAKLLSRTSGLNNPVNQSPDSTADPSRTNHRSLTLLGKMRIGVSASLLAALVILSGETAALLPGLLEHRLAVVGIAGAVGVALWILGYFRAGVQECEESPFQFLATPRYWSVMIVLLALVFYVRTNEPEKIAAREAHAGNASAPPRIARPMPKLKLQGITFQAGAATALINRRIYEVGHHIEEAEVAAIGPDSVTIVLDGQTNILRLDAGLIAFGQTAAERKGPQAKTR